jgi:hypothetical protein
MFPVLLPAERRVVSSMGRDPKEAALTTKVTCQSLILLALIAVCATSSGCQQRVHVTHGYLSKGPPVALRFAPPEQFAVQLPPLPKSPDPQPSALPNIDAEASPAVGAPDQSAASAVSSPKQTVENNGSVANSSEPPPMRVRIPVDLTGVPGQVSPQMLIRFFPDGKPSQIEFFVNPRSGTEIPNDLPSSSAQYSVK